MLTEPTTTVVDDLRTTERRPVAVAATVLHRFSIVRCADVGGPYELRLAGDGDERSVWSLPTGPSIDPRDVRVARRIDGVGGSDCGVWDDGSWIPTTGPDGEYVSMQDALTDGGLELCLEGRKVRGTYRLDHVLGDRWELRRVR